MGELVAGEQEAADAEEAWLFIDKEDGYIDIRDNLLDEPGVEVVSQERDLPIETNFPINRQRKPVTSDTPRQESSGARVRDHRPKRPDSPYPGQRSMPLARVRANMVRREDCQHPPPFPLHLRQTEPGYAIIVKETNV